MKPSLLELALIIGALLSSQVQCFGKRVSNDVQLQLVYRGAIDLLNQDRLDESENKFRDALDINPKHAPSYVGLGHVYLKRSDLKQAEQAFRQALRKRKNYAPAP